MNKFSKGKLIGVVAASLSAVSLVGVGFATWIIGTRTTTNNGDISIVADDVKYQSLRVSVDFGAAGITLAETGDPAAEGSDFTYTDTGKRGNLAVKATFTFTIGTDFAAEDFNNSYNVINFAIADTREDAEATNYVDNKVADGAAFTRAAGTKDLTYFELPDSVTGLTYESLKFQVSDDNNFIKTATKEVDLQFKWGSLFGNTGAITEQGKSPMVYYNETIKTYGGDKDEYMQKAYQELKAMQNKYTAGKKLKLQISLGYKA